MSSCLQSGAMVRSLVARDPASAASSRKRVEQLVERERRLLASALAHRERVVRLAVAVDDDERHLLELGVADPLAERLVALVDLDAVALGLEPLAKRSRQPRDAPRPTGITRTCTGASQNGNAPA